MTALCLKVLTILKDSFSNFFVIFDRTMEKLIFWKFKLLIMMTTHLQQFGPYL